MLALRTKLVKMVNGPVVRELSHLHAGSTPTLRVRNQTVNGVQLGNVGDNVNLWQQNGK